MQSTIFRRSFTEGDSHYEAQFWYARELFLQGHFADAKKFFSALNDRAPGRFRTRAALPSIYGFREPVEVGGLMSYGPNIVDLFRRAGDYVDKIPAGHQRRKRGVVDCTAAHAVAVPPLASEMGNTVTAKGPRRPLQSSGDSAHR